MRFVCEDIKRQIRAIKAAGGRPRTVTIGRQLLRDFLDNLKTDYQWRNIDQIEIFNAVQCNAPEAWLRRRRFTTYRGLALTIVEGNQLTVE